MIKEKFLIDANSFITASRLFYAKDLVPSFWPTFENSLKQDNVALLDVVKEEILKGEDFLAEWIKSLDDILIIKRDDGKVVEKYQAVMEYIHTGGYYNDKALKIWSDFNVADPWLIAAAAAYGYTIVTFEQSAGVITLRNPSGKPKIPDVANHFKVKCGDLYYYMRVQGIQI